MEELTCSQMENICGGMKQGTSEEGSTYGGGICWSAVGWGLLTIFAGFTGQIAFGAGFAMAGVEALHECYG